MSDEDPPDWELPERKPRESKPPPKASWEAPAPPAPEPAPAPPVPATASDDPLAPLSSRRPPTPLPLPDEDPADDEPPARSSGRLWLFVAVILLAGLGVGALVLLGSLNQRRYTLTCSAAEASAGHGRVFPPWGTRSFDDDGTWKPIPLSPETPCSDLETDDEDRLSAAYLDLLYERARALLTAREVTKVDDAALLLHQAQLHARTPGRADKRKLVESLLGDVEYWRASAKLREAATALDDAARQFDAAAAQRPYAVTDAAAWAIHVRTLVERLRGGPNKMPATVFPPAPPVDAERPGASPGVALPIEPPSAPGAAPAPPPDAGVPGGGILL